MGDLNYGPPPHLSFGHLLPAGEKNHLPPHALIHDLSPVLLRDLLLESLHDFLGAMLHACVSMNAVNEIKFLGAS